METANRYQHRYILGQTGTGKSTCLLNFAIKDIADGAGVLYFDFHGDDSSTLLSQIPEERAGDVVIFDPANAPSPINFLENHEPELRPLAAASMLEAVKSVWGYDSLATPTLDQCFYNSVAALLDRPGSTLLGAHYLLLSYDYRQEVLKDIKDPVVRDFWIDFDRLPAKEMRDLTRSTLNKTGFIMSDARIRRVLGYHKSVFNLKDVLRTSKILIVRLPHGQLGMQKAQLLAALILANLHVLALGREERSPFHVYLDECHHFPTGVVTEMLSGIRKFKVSLTLAHQYIEQLEPKFRAAIFGNIGTKYIFRVGTEDAAALRFTEFAPNSVYEAVDQLPPYTARVSYFGQAPADVPMPKLPVPQPQAVRDWIVANYETHYAKDPKKIDSSIAKFINSLT